MERLTTRIILPDGPFNSKSCWLGEAPGADELTKPFQGKAGQFHNRCLGQKGVTRASVCTRNIFSQQPPGNDEGYFFQDKGKRIPTWEGQEHIDELTTWLEQRLADREKGAGGPNVLAALGATSMQVLTGKRRINKWRGSILECTLVPGFKVYPTYHPSYVQRLMNEQREKLAGEKKKQQQNVLPLYLIDIERIMTQAEFPEIRRPERVFDVDLSFGEIITRLKEIALTKVPLTVGVDIETLRGETGPVTWMIGFSTLPDQAFTVPLLHRMQLKWTLEEEAQIWYWVSVIFLNELVKKVFQGGMYDLSVLGRYYGLRVANYTYEDTMLCHHASYPYIRKGLEVLASIYTWEPYYKDEGKVHAGKRVGDLAEAHYNCKDTSVTREIIPITLSNARQLGTLEGYRRTLSVVPSLLGMMIRGVRIDVEKKEKLGTEFGVKADEHYARISELIEWPSPININSPDQVRRLLYGQLGLEPQYHLKTKKPTTGKDALKKLFKKAKEGSIAKTVLEHMIEYKKLSKLVSTYTSMEVGVDGRIYTSYGFISTWRTSSSKSHFGGGGNLQNIPVRTEEGKMVRCLFIPDEDQTMLAADYAKAEAMVVAWEAEDLPLIEAFLAGIDVHWEKAKEIFGLPASLEYSPKEKFLCTITGSTHSHWDYRNIGKIVVHAGNYGEGPFQLQATLAREGFHFPISVCKRMIGQFKMRNPATMAWQRRIREQLRATRTLISSFDRKREFMGRINDNLFRSGYAFSPQNTVGEMLEVAAQNVWTNLPYIEILMNVHDEIIMQLKPEDLQRSLPEVRKQMEQTIEIKGRPLTIPVDFKTGPSWGELVEI